VYVAPAWSSTSGSAFVAPLAQYTPAVVAGGENAVQLGAGQYATPGLLGHPGTPHIILFRVGTFRGRGSA
jgi:hypothetical protein